MVQPPFEIFLVPTWLRVPIWFGTKIRGEIVNEAARRPSPSRSAKAMESGEVDGWHTSVLTPVNEDVYAKQCENKVAEAQITYT